MLPKDKVQFPPLERELENQSTGARMHFRMRPFACGDEQGMIDCIRDEYADSYFKQDFYDPVRLREKALGEHYVFFVAETDGEIAGMEIFALFCEHGDDYIEPASQILRIKYRGFGLSAALVEYTFPLAKAMRPSALFVHAVTFHTITQRVCEAQGMRATGFRLGRFLTERMQNSYERGRCPKYSEGIMILPLEKREAGTVYVPKELYGFVSDCYDRLDMSYALCHEGAPLPSSPAQLLISTDELQRMVLIRLERYGADVVEQVRASLADRDRNGWTCQIKLPVCDGCAVTVYERLREIGFFFAGVQAACSDREWIYMQWCGDMELYLEDYALTEEFCLLRDAIKRFYDRRKDL